MSKKEFIALADEIREHNRVFDGEGKFRQAHLDCLADFCKSQNPSFLRDRWLGYIRGECGPNDGEVKK